MKEKRAATVSAFLTVGSSLRVSCMYARPTVRKSLTVATILPHSTARAPRFNPKSKILRSEQRPIPQFRAHGEFVGEVLDFLENPIDIQAVLGVQQRGCAVRDNAVGNG